MANRLMLALAAALFLATPFTVAGSAPGDAFTQDTRVVAEVTDVHGIPVEQQRAAPEARAVSAGVTEGHTTYAVIDVVHRATDAPVHVVGHVACRYVVLGVDVPGPARFHRDGDACTPGARVMIAPTGSPPPADADALEPTGWEDVVHAPDTRRPVRVTEYAYRVDEDGWTRVAYAWESEILPGGVNPHTGKAFNFVAAVNPERLAELDTNRLTVWKDA